MEYCYPLMKDWVDYIDREDGEREEKHYLFDFGFHFGDWFALDGVSQTSYKGSTDDTISERAKSIFEYIAPIKMQAAG